MPTEVDVKTVAVGHRPRVPSPSLVALALALLAEGTAVAIVLNVDSDTSGVRWWLVLAPAVLTALPLLTRVRAVRIAVAAALVVWCAVAAASIGLFFVPATVAALVAARDWGPA